MHKKAFMVADIVRAVTATAPRLSDCGCCRFRRGPLQRAHFHQEVAPEAFIGVKETGSYR